MKWTRVLLVVFFLFSSCDRMGEKLQKKVLPPMDTLVDYHKIDLLPLHPGCNSESSKFDQERCTRDSLYRSVALPLLMMDFKVDHPVNTEVMIRLLVDKQGRVSMHEVLPKDGLSKVPGLYDSVKQVVNDLPTMKPAIKKGQAIRVYYNLPLVLNTDS